jgi:hypothetical protein
MNSTASPRQGGPPPLLIERPVVRVEWRCSPGLERHLWQRDPAVARPSPTPIVGAGKFRSAQLLTTSSIGRCFPPSLSDLTEIT